jgi:hypothetical protein
MVILARMSAVLGATCEERPAGQFVNQCLEWAQESSILRNKKGWSSILAKLPEAGLFCLVAPKPAVKRKARVQGRRNKAIRPIRRIVFAHDQAFVPLRVPSDVDKIRERWHALD